MVCPNCGNEVHPDQHVCPTCGEDMSQLLPTTSSLPFQTLTPQKKPWYTTRLAKVVLGAFVVYLAARLVYTVRMGQSITTQESPSVEQSGAEGSTEDTTTESRAYSGHLEDHGYPTLLAFMELDGKELSDLVLSNGYEYYTKTDRPVYRKSDGSIVFNAISDGLLTQEEFEGLSVGGHSEPVVYMIIVKGFGSPEAVIKGMAGCEIDGAMLYGDEEGVAVIHDPSDASYLVDVVDVEDGDYEIRLYPTEALAERAFDKDKGGQYGSTPSEVLDRYHP